MDKHLPLVFEQHRLLDGHPLSSRPKRAADFSSLLLTIYALAWLLGGCRQQGALFSGRVTDQVSGKPIVGAVVTASQTGWGLRAGRPVWDMAIASQAQTDETGAFSLQPALGSGMLVGITKDGYIPYREWHYPSDSVSITLHPARAANPALVKGVLELGYQDGVPYGWNFAHQTITRDENEADLFPLGEGARYTQVMTLTTTSQGGIATQTATTLGVTSNLIFASDTAPASGYAPTVNLTLTGASSLDGALYFVRTRDGQHYAKFVFDPSNYSPIGSDLDKQHGTWGLLLDYTYNPDGSRDLAIDPE
jgi:hypothetical protein